MNDSIMVALLPTTTDWCDIELPHLTVVFSGKVEDRPSTEFNVLAKDVSYLASIARIIKLDVTSIDKLGPPEEEVSALIFRKTTELMAIRQALLQWDESEWPDYKPHATIGPYPTEKFKPEQLTFDRLLLAWGDEHLTFLLNP